MTQTPFPDRPMPKNNDPIDYDLRDPSRPDAVNPHPRHSPDWHEWEAAHLLHCAPHPDYRPPDAPADETPLDLSTIPPTDWYQRAFYRPIAVPAHLQPQLDAVGLRDDESYITPRLDPVCLAMEEHYHVSPPWFIGPSRAPRGRHLIFMLLHDEILDPPPAPRP